MERELSDLFESVILDHDARPRHFFAMPDATHTASAINPVCGDRFEFFLDVDRQGCLIRSASFQGRGCAMSKASASIMVQMIEGMTVGEARKLRLALGESLHAQETRDRRGGPNVEESEVELPLDLEALTGVRDHPSRHRCVMLAWDAMAEALDSGPPPPPR